jgi:hypothetical protein
LIRSQKNYHQERIKNEDCKPLRAIRGSYDDNILAVSMIEVAQGKIPVSLLNLKEQVGKDERNDLFRSSG